MVFAVWIASADQPAHATFAITPAQPLMDERLSIRISSLPPNGPVMIRARSKACDQLCWRSEAVFQSGADGAIDLGSQAPLSGTYRTVDAMGLFWSMQPDTKPKKADHAFFAVEDWFSPIITEFEAVCENQIVGRARVERRFAKPAVQCTAVKEDGIAAFLYEPGDGQKHPGVIVLGGSEGGFGGQSEAAMLASRGFAALSLAYFGVKGLPPTLQNIPIEYFGKAIQWLRARPGVDADAIVLFGGSRGAEAALLVGAAYPEVKAVIAKAPAHVYWEGLTASTMPGGPAWTSAGEPLPYVRNRIGFGVVTRFAWSKLTGAPMPLTPMFLENLDDAARGPDAEIRVENIRGPVLLISGKEDLLWPSSLMGNRVLERLRQKGHPYADTHLSYEGAGHSLPCAYLPTAGSRQQLKRAIGGTPEGTAKAQADLWPRILRFLTRLSDERKNHQ